MNCAYCNFQVDLAAPDASSQMADHVTNCEKSPLVQILKRMQPTWDLAIGFAQECVDDKDDCISPGLKEKARRVVRLANKSQCGCAEDAFCSVCEPENYYATGEEAPS